MGNNLTLSVKDTAKILGRTEQFIRFGLRQKVLPFGAAVKMDNEYSYIIYKKKFEEFTGIKIEDAQNE